LWPSLKTFHFLDVPLEVRKRLGSLGFNPNFPHLEVGEITQLIRSNHWSDHFRPETSSRTWFRVFLRSLKQSPAKLFLMPTTGSEPIPQTTGGRRETWPGGWLVGAVDLIGEKSIQITSNHPGYQQNDDLEATPTSRWRGAISWDIQGVSICIVWFQMYVSKNSGTPKLDGENRGKNPLFLNGWFGWGKNPLFLVGSTPKWGARFLAPRKSIPSPTPPANWGFLALASGHVSDPFSVIKACGMAAPWSGWNVVEFSGGKF